MKRSELTKGVKLVLENYHFEKQMSVNANRFHDLNICL